MRAKTDSQVYWHPDDRLISKLMFSTLRDLPAAGGNRKPSPEREKQLGDIVRSSVYAPLTAAPDEQVMIQIVVHFLEQEIEIQDLAISFDDSAHKRGSLYRTKN